MEYAAPFELMDLYRRQVGSSLDLLGVCRVETRSRIVLSKPLFNLLAYAERNDGPILLLIPAPIKQAYLWDLLPEVSVVRRCLSNDIRPYLLQWKDPGRSVQDAGLAGYSDTFILQSIEAIQRETGKQTVFLAGHSLGGTFAAIFSTLHPDLVQGLITLGSPMHFGRDAGVFVPMVSAMPSAAPLSSGDVPGTFLDMVSYLAAPYTFGLRRWIDLFLTLGDIEAMRIHFCVERWSLDELPLTRSLFEDVVDLLYHEDRFMQGSLVINGKRAVAQNAHAPIVTVADSECPVVPPRSILPFHEAAPAAGKLLLWYQGEAGVAMRHVGLLVGRESHRRIWPEIVQWIHDHEMQVSGNSYSRA